MNLAAAAEIWARLEQVLAEHGIAPDPRLDRARPALIRVLIERLGGGEPVLEALHSLVFGGLRRRSCPRRAG